MGSCHEGSCCSSECGCPSSCHCRQNSCCSSSECCSGEQDKSKKLLLLADQAWMEVLKDKIKKHIETNDKKLDELAKIVSEANHERWRRKMEKEQSCASYREKLDALFGCCGDHCKTK